MIILLSFSLLNYWFTKNHGHLLLTIICSVALLYSAFGVALSKMRDADDEINTVCAGTATGLLYKSFGEFFLVIFHRNAASLFWWNLL